MKHLKNKNSMIIMNKFTFIIIILGIVLISGCTHLSGPTEEEISLCDNLEYPKDYFYLKRAECFANLAVKYHNSSICKEVEKHWGGWPVSVCYSMVAESLKDISICKKEVVEACSGISGIFKTACEDQKDVCLHAVAVASNDKGICDMISENREKHYGGVNPEKTECYSDIAKQRGLIG
jgi:hypothetical protein